MVEFLSLPFLQWLFLKKIDTRLLLPFPWSIKVIWLGPLTSKLIIARVCEQIYDSDSATLDWGQLFLSLSVCLSVLVSAFEFDSLFSLDAFEMVFLGGHHLFMWLCSSVCLFVCSRKL